MKIVNEISVEIVLCNYGPIVVSKFRKIQRKILCMSASLAVIISLMPYHVFTDGNMDLA